MKNKYKSAGVWNILCGVLFTIAYIIPIVCLGVNMFDWGDIAASSFYFAIVLFFSVYLWESLIMFPFFMILTGSEMISRRKKGTGVKALIVFSALFKLLAVAYDLSLGYLYLTAPALVLCGVALIVTAAFILISVVMDIRSLFQRKSKKRG